MGLVSFGATLCARSVQFGMVGYLTNKLTPNGQAWWLVTLADTPPTGLYGFQLLPRHTPHFPYGHVVDPDEPV